MIPIINVGASYGELRGEIDKAVRDLLESGWYIGGAAVDGFECEFARYCGADHCVGTGNGLEALALSLRSLGIGPGDEVIVPANTYIASWLAITMVGAIPVPVEPDERSYCIDPALISAAITARTRCIMPVHLYGYPCAMNEIVAIARAHGLLIVEDAAQAHGAAIGGRNVGSHGDAVAWSFYPTKNLGAFGDGGAVTTNRPDVAEKIRQLRNYGSEEKNIHLVKGVNSRLDPMQAVILSVKLRHLDAWQQRRQAIVRVYDQAFAGINGLTSPTTALGTRHAWHLYVIRCEERDSVARRLAENNVASAVHYPTPPYLQPAYAEFRDRADEWPLSTRLAETLLSIPMDPHLTLDQADQVADAVRRALDA